MKRSNKGFTLVEMLVVVAIISVLAAVLIPVVSNSLVKAKEAADISNLRSAYAQYEIEILTDVPAFNAEAEGSLTANDFLKAYGISELNYADNASFAKAADGAPASITYSCKKTLGSDRKGVVYSWKLQGMDED